MQRRSRAHDPTCRSPSPPRRSGRTRKNPGAPSIPVQGRSAHRSRGRSGHAGDPASGRRGPLPPVTPAADEVPVLIKRLDPGLPLPARAHPGDAGADLVTAVDVELAPGQRAVVPTGVAIALPDGYAAFVHPRSGLAARHGVTIVNAPGTVDAGY